MKAVFGKRLPYFLALIGVQIIIILIVVTWTFEDSVGFFGSIYNMFVESPAIFNILNLIADYADIFSGLVVCVALALLFISLRKYHRDRAVNRLHGWARNGVVVLAQYRQGKKGDDDDPINRGEELRLIMDRLLATSKTALTDAGYLGGAVGDKARQTVEELRIIRSKLADEDTSLYDNLQELQHSFADTMILAFELIK